MSDPEDVPTRSADTLGALRDAPDLMADPVQRRRQAAMRARLFGTRAQGRFGRYRLGKRLGAGAMGVVQVAHDPTLDRDVALKILRDPGSDERARLLREARAVAQVAHENVIEVFEVGTIDGEAFIALELVDGVTLRQWAEPAPRGWAEVVAVYAQAGRGLAAAHEHGLVHRDFKPDNAMLGRDGRVRVLDFGLARGQGPTLTPTEGGEEPGPQDAMLTASGAMAGTPAYMAPELFGGAAADARSDQFALAVSIYEAIFGERPFGGRTIPELVDRVLSGQRRPRPPSVRVPSGVVAALERALEPEPEARWSSVAAFVDALEAVDRQTRRRGPLAMVGLAVVATVTAIGLYALWPGEPAPVAATCSTGEQRLQGVWDDERRRSLLEGWRRSDGEVSPGAVAVVSTLDARAEVWADAWTEVCIELDDANDLDVDARARCLEQRVEHLRGVVDGLAEVPATRLHRALGLVDGLPSDDCADSGAGFPLPPQPQRAAAVEQTLAAARRAGIRCRLHGPRACREPLEAALDEARRLEHPPLLVFALQQAGALEELAGEAERAAERFEEAFFAARASGRDEQAAKAAVSLVHLVGYRQRRPDEAERWIRQAEAVLEGVDDPRLRGDLLNNRGLVRMSQGHAAEAEQDYREALSSYESMDEPPTDTIANTLVNLAQIAYERRDLDGAAGLLERALQQRARRFGPDNPYAATVLNNRALVHKERGDLEAAREDLLRAIEVTERNVGLEHAELVPMLTNLGEVLRRRRELDAAQSALERAADIASGLDMDHPRRLEVRAQLALARAERGQTEEAVDELQRILGLQRDADGRDPFDLAETELRIGDVLLRAGGAGRARSFLESALVRVEAEPARDFVGLAALATALGEARLEHDALAEALPLLEQAWGLRFPGPGLASERGRTAFALARALAATRDRDALDRARGLAEQAEEAYAQAGPAYLREQREAARWLARAPNRFP